MDTTYAEIDTEVILLPFIGSLAAETQPCFTWSKTCEWTKAKINDDVSYDMILGWACRVEMKPQVVAYWPIQYMILSSDAPLLTPEQKGKIKDYYE